VTQAAVSKAVRTPSEDGIQQPQTPYMPCAATKGALVGVNGAKHLL
jgi:hypothetical protein